MFLCTYYRFNRIGVSLCTLKSITANSINSALSSIPLFSHFLFPFRSSSSVPSFPPVFPSPFLVSFLPSFCLCYWSVVLWVGCVCVCLPGKTTSFANPKNINILKIIIWIESSVLRFFFSSSSSNWLWLNEFFFLFTHRLEETQFSSYPVDVSTFFGSWPFIWTNERGTPENTKKVH